MDGKKKGGKPKILVTGVSGYLGSHVTKKLVESGQYTVFGSYRSKTDAKENQKFFDLLKEGFGEEIYNQIEFVDMDLLKEDTVKSAVKGMDYIMHVASPFPGESPKDEMEVVGPAVEGSKVVMKAAIENGVKRVV